MPQRCHGGCSFQQLYHILLRRLKIRPRAFLKRNSIGVKTINALTMAITNRKLFFKGLKLRDTQWPFTGKVPEVDYSENSRENSDIRKVENGSYSKEIFKKAW